MTSGTRILSACVVVLAAASLATGCASKRQTEKQNNNEGDLFSQYDGANYDDMETVEGDEVDDQGDSVAPGTLQNIKDTIENVYERDFGRCLQKDMDAFENRWIAGTFTLSVTINTEGKVIGAELTQIDIEERKVPKGKTARKAEIFPGCVEESAYKWEFDPPPEIEYTHTYSGKVGEAF